MLTEPNIETGAIKQLIEINYDLVVQGLTFVKQGEASWAYIVNTPEKKYFFKIHTNLNHYEERFLLVYELFTDFGIKNTTHPIRTNAEGLVVMLGGYPCALFNFISGGNASEREMTEEQRFSLGVTLGRIHIAKNLQGDFSHIEEDFRYNNIDRLVSTTQKLDKYLMSDSEIIKKTAVMLLENKERIDQRIQELTMQGDILRGGVIEFVPCHGEPHKWNTMIDSSGEVYLIDWDDSCFAPREKDLNTVKGDTVIMDGYRSVCGDVGINEEVIRYYNIEWNVSEIDAWSNSIFFEEHNDKQKQHFLDELTSDISELET